MNSAMVPIGLNEFGPNCRIGEQTRKQLEKFGFFDQSWHNDVAPRLGIIADDGSEFSVWVHNDDPKRREVGEDKKKFWINIVGPDGTDDFRYVRETDDEAEVIPFVKDGFNFWNRMTKNTNTSTEQKSNAPARSTTTSKEVNMAAKKKAQKKSAKKAVKKAAKKAAKTATRKPAEKKTATREAATRKKASGKTPLSRFVCQKLVDGMSDEQIIEAMKRDYPDKDCSQKTVSWYRFAINHGRMEKVGFPAPKGGLVNPRRETAERRRVEKAEKKETKKAARRKVARRKRS